MSITSTDTSVGAVFAGHYRKAVKTAIFRDTSGHIATAELVADVPTLIKSVPPDADMRAKYPDLVLDGNASPETREAAVPFRVAEEQRNVTIPAWIWYVKKEVDNDIHVIIGSSADPTAVTYLNVEVSGLPDVANSPDFGVLQSMRQQLVSLLGHEPGTADFEPFNPPLAVTITGSLLFDADHQPGEVGPVGHQPDTTWEIHPVISIEPRQPPQTGMAAPLTR